MPDRIEEEAREVALKLWDGDSGDEPEIIEAIANFAKRVAMRELREAAGHPGIAHGIVNWLRARADALEAEGQG